jgi:hypothetical protein
VREFITGTTVDVVLQARERGLTGEIGIIVETATAHQLQEGITPQGIGIILVLVATGDLKDALAD